MALAGSSITIVSVPYEPSGKMIVLVITFGPWVAASSPLVSSPFICKSSALNSGKLPIFLLIVSKAFSISFYEFAYSPMIQRATLMTRWDLMSSKLLHIFSKMATLCSGCNSITSLINKIVSRLVKVLLLSNIKNESIKGLIKAGIVSGYVYDKVLIELINKYLYSLVVTA